MPYGLNDTRDLIKLVFNINHASVLYKAETSYLNQFWKFFNFNFQQTVIELEQNEIDALNIFIKITFNDETVNK